MIANGPETETMDCAYATTTLDRGTKTDESSSPSFKWEPPTCPDESEYELTEEQAATCALIRRNVATIVRCVEEIQERLDPKPWHTAYEFFDDLRDSATGCFLAYAMDFALADDAPADHLDERTHDDWAEAGEPDLDQWLRERSPEAWQGDFGGVEFVESDAIPEGWALVAEGDIVEGDRYLFRLGDGSLAWVPIYETYEGVSHRAHRRLIRRLTADAPNGRK